MSHYQAPRGDQPQPGRYSTIVGIDPRIEWLLGPGFRYFQPYGPESLIPFTVRLEDKGLLDPILRPLPDQRGAAVLPIGPARDRSSKYATLLAPKSFFDLLAQPDGPLQEFARAAKRIELSLPLPPRCLPPWKPGDLVPEVATPDIGPPPGGWPPKTVIIAVIDDGIAFAHARFRDALGKTRIQCFWHQDGTYPSSTPTVEFGREFLKAEIDQLLQDNDEAGIIDEDAVYQQAGVIDFSIPDHKPLGWRLAHGTHVLDLAAGADPDNAPANHPVICVQLPVAATALQSGAGLEDFVLLAFDYIQKRAALLAGGGDPLPVVINFSYGLMMGPKDSTGRIEEAMDDIVRASDCKAPIRFVLPAGNSQLTRTSASLRFAATGDSATLKLRVQPDDRTVSQVQFWLPRAGTTAPATSRLSLIVIPPGSTTSSGPITETSLPVLSITFGGAAIGQVAYAFAGPATNRGVFTLTLNPTEPPPDLPDDPLAPHGAWTIELRNTDPSGGQTVQAWVERDDQLYGYPRLGRQSYFDAPCYERFDEAGRPLADDPPTVDCPVRRKGLISAIATGSLSFVVGGFEKKGLEAADYSAGGPTCPPPSGTIDPKPDALFVSDDSKVHTGVLAAGSRTGSVVAMAGTSVAAPQLARHVVEHLADTEIGRAEVKNLAQTEEALLPATKPPLPAERGGWGRIGALSGPPPAYRQRYWPDP